MTETERQGETETERKRDTERHRDRNIHRNRDGGEKDTMYFLTMGVVSLMVYMAG